jgi:sec-independent protein translocase protein TatA
MEETNMGTTEIIVIAGVGLMMFGPARIPEFAKQCGKAVSLFKNGMREALDDEPAEPAKASKKRAGAR